MQGARLVVVGGAVEGEDHDVGLALVRAGQRGVGRAQPRPVRGEGLRGREVGRLKRPRPPDRLVREPGRDMQE